MENMTADEKAFGSERWVYCKSHVRPHTTGWCTVRVDDKVLLDAKTREEAIAESRSKGFKIYGE